MFGGRLSVSIQSERNSAKRIRQKGCGVSHICIYMYFYLYIVQILGQGPPNFETCLKIHFFPVNRISTKCIAFC